ncbi:MAG: phosphopantetheine-binding protein [Bryobacteraceae bacterium]|jgi:acyl carrier protein
MSSFGVPEQGLVLREQLPLPRPYVAPGTPTEQRLAEIWRAVLSMDCVGVEDRYIDLGGDSFLAAAILDKIEETFRFTLPMAVFAEAPTIATLASRIDGRSPGGVNGSP